MGEIRDPESQRGIRVTTEFRATVESKTFAASELSNIDHKDAYVMELPAVTLTAAWVWAAIKNTADTEVIITRCVLWTVVNKSNDWVAAYTRGAFTYSANGTVATPANCNSGGALSAEGSFYYNDGVGDLATITAGQSCGSILVTAAPQEFVIESKWIVPKNQTWYLKSELANDNTYQGWIEFHYH